MTPPHGSAGPDPVDALVIGIDIGTRNSKGVACRADGTVVARARLEHRVSSPRPGWFELDAETVLWGDTVAICRQLLAEVGSGSRVRGVAVTTCGPCLVPVDAEGRALRPAILYGVDTRAEAEIQEMDGRIGRGVIADLSRMPLTSQAVGPKIAWVVGHEPDVARRTATWHTATSYLVAQLTGISVIDHHQASYFTPFVDAGRRAWDLRHATGLDLDGKLPPIRWPGEVAGGVTASAASATGLVEGTPVLVGTSDGPTEALAVGASRPGIVAATYGSTTTLTTFTDAIGSTAGLWESEGWSPDRRCVAAGLSTGGAIVDWFHREFASDLPDGDDAGPDRALATLAEEAAASPPGAHGLVVLPYFSGERTPFADPLARGVIAGLTLAHGRGDVHRAILEGIAFGIRQIIEAFDAAGVPVERLRAAGGGTLSPIALQIVSDVTGREQDVPRETVGASFGAAFLAASAVGLVGDDDERPDAWFQLDRRVRPDPASTALYDRRYPLFRQLYLDTAATVHELAALALAESPTAAADPAGERA
jgi:xylulokinase